MPKTGQLARVGVPAETWHQFRQVALARGVSISAYLAELVEKELGRRRGTPIEAISVDMPASDQAVTALDEVRRSIDELDDIAGRLARSAIAAGGSWADVGSSLRLRPDQAKRAFERQPS